MSRKRFSVLSSSRPLGGFTVMEVLVGLAIASLVIAGVGTGVVFGTRAWTDNGARLQAQQSLRLAVEVISRETRLAGACMLPYSTGTAPPANFQPLDGVHFGTTDTIVVRSNSACAQATTTAACSSCASMTVDNITNFAVGAWAYLFNPTLRINQYFRIATITGNVIGVSPSTPITANYPTGTTVFGIDQRTFAISSSCGDCGGTPTLTEQTLNIGQAALVKGIDSISVQYVLNRLYNITTCDARTGGSPNLCVVNLPTSAPSVAGDWQLVRVVIFTVDARSTVPTRATGSPDGYLHLSDSFEIAPRNFVFSQGGRL